MSWVIFGSVRGRLTRIAILAALGAGCGSRATAVEDVGDADLRVFVTFSNAQPTVQALAGDTPYRRDLSEIVGGGSADASLEIWVFGYSLAELVAAYPVLEGRSVQDVVQLLAPASAPSSGARGYDPPPARHVLSTTIDDSNWRSTEYAARTWDDWVSTTGQEDRKPFYFFLPDEIGCPDADKAFRVFSPQAPGRACTGSRTGPCQWQLPAECAGVLREMCPALETSVVLERGDGTLALGDSTCARATPPESTLGISAMWQCPAGVCTTDPAAIAIQNAQLTQAGSAVESWVPSARAEDQVTLGGGNEPTFGGQFAAARQSTIYAWVQDLKIRFSRFRMTRRTAAEDAKDDNTLTHNRRALSLLADDVGDLVRISADVGGDLVVVNGTNGSSVLTRRTELDYEAPVAIDHAVFGGMLVGEIVAARQPGRERVYAAVTAGIAILRKDALDAIETTTPAGRGPTLNRSVHHHLTVATSGPSERLVVCPHRDVGVAGRTLCSERTLHVYDDRAAFLFSCDIPGDVLAIVEGFDVLYRPETDAFELRMASLGTVDCTDRGVRYLLPPTGPTTAPRVYVARDGHFAVEAHRLVGYSYDQHVGMLDLATGHSAAILPSASGGSRARTVPVLFEGPLSSHLWAIGKSPDVTGYYDRVRFPLLSPVLR